MIRQGPQMQNTTYYIHQQPQIQTSPSQQQLVQVQAAMQTHQQHAQIGTQQTMQGINALNLIDYSSKKKDILINSQ